MANPDGRNEGSVKRRIAATAATAALALSGPAVAARPASARTASSSRPGGEPITLLAHSDQSRAATSLEVSRRADMASHRHRLAGALAAELGNDGPADRIERALAAADAEISKAYSRGQRPQFAGGLPVALTRSSGISEATLSEAFESMSKRALERRRAGAADTFR
jgi:hypothetical protein